MSSNWEYEIKVGLLYRRIEVKVSSEWHQQVQLELNRLHQWMQFCDWSPLVIDSLFGQWISEGYVCLYATIQIDHVKTFEIIHQSPRWLHITVGKYLIHWKFCRFKMAGKQILKWIDIQPVYCWYQHSYLRQLITNENEITWYGIATRGYTW